MSIQRMELNDSPVFKGEFAVDFCPGVNVLIGANGTGKTTLLKEMYKNTAGNQVYFPEKDILEHSRGLLPFIHGKQSGFSRIYWDVLVAGQDVPTRLQSETQKSVGQKISDIIDGEAYWDMHAGGYFYTLKKDGSRVLFADESSGYKKFGFLGILVSSGQLDPGAVLFWDEPENSLSPELVPVLVDILLELTKSGVQIFIATHDYSIARYFDVRKDKSIPILFHSMTKSDGKIFCHSEADYMRLPNNLLETAGANLFEAVVADAMEIQRDG